jgi:hypothetical protein
MSEVRFDRLVAQLQLDEMRTVALRLSSRALRMKEIEEARAMTGDSSHDTHFNPAAARASMFASKFRMSFNSDGGVASSGHNSHTGTFNNGTFDTSDPELAIEAPLSVSL